MFEKMNYTGTKEEQYGMVIRQLKELSHEVKKQVTILSNASALLGSFLQDINWVGFYVYEHGQLWLGPFQGLPACTQIPMGKGVCGTAAQQRKTIVVPNVHEFPGHIACDAASKSEIVIPIVVSGELYGVLDIDSPIENRFDTVDQECLEQFVKILASFLGDNL